MDAKRWSSNTVAGLPAKTLENKAGRAAGMPHYSGDFYPNPKSPLRSAPKDFALRAACTLRSALANT